MARYKSPVDGSELLKTKNPDGEEVYRDRSTGSEYTEAQLKEQGVETLRDSAPKSKSSKKK
jgi:hypothetical protein